MFLQVFATLNKVVLVADLLQQIEITVPKITVVQIVFLTTLEFAL